MTSTFFWKKVDVTFNFFDTVRGSHAVDVPINWTSGALTKVGNAGTLDVRNMRGNDLNINGGTLVARANGSIDGTSKLHALTIAAGATFDLTNNDLIVGAGTSKSQVESSIARLQPADCAAVSHRNRSPWACSAARNTRAPGATARSAVKAISRPTRS